MNEEEYRSFLKTKNSGHQVLGSYGQFLNSSFQPSLSATFGVSPAPPNFFSGVQYNSPYSNTQQWNIPYATTSSPAALHSTNFNTTDVKRSPIGHVNFGESRDDKTTFKFSPFHPMQYHQHSLLDSAVAAAAAAYSPNLIHLQQQPNHHHHFLPSSSSSTTINFPIKNNVLHQESISVAPDSPTVSDDEDKCNQHRKERNLLRLDPSSGKKLKHTSTTTTTRPQRQEIRTTTPKIETVFAQDTTTTTTTTTVIRKVKSRTILDDSNLLESEGKCNSSKINIMSESEVANTNPSLSSSSSNATDKKNDPLKLTGHLRLIIQFSFIGKKGKYPQTCGNGNKIFIPDRLAGFHTAYHQRWGFDVRHGTESFEKNGLQCVCLVWTITNVASGNVHSLTETPKEAFTRCSHGRTIASKVFREAMLHEARELENHLKDEGDEFRSANMQSLIKALRPKNFSEGLLVFGLQHERVQEEIEF